MAVARRPHPLELPGIVLRAVGRFLAAHNVGSFAAMSGGIGIVRCPS
jgi:hypothetical protein